ncbi:MULTISPECIES: hypothetical protein [Neobacillus]|uniref:Uncharacterized protein n=1 Tax=Neobacillus citreus TaxID=2833578 RepID=A0A942YBB6_9BACI|nr:hypothetical protein [Neobacillus citreus]MCH6267484.1 hypothetical protein [Neobacillus citreus]
MRVSETTKQLYSLSVSLECFEGISHHVSINFLKERFVYTEWRNQPEQHSVSPLPVFKPGSLEQFKRKIYSMRIWEWEPTYQKENGIVLDGNFWTVTLKTQEKTYEFGGMESFPANWGRFLKALEMLVGVPFGKLV